MSRREQQTRSMPTRFSTREAEDGKLYIEGYFAVYGSVYEMWEGASETILPGAFDGQTEGDVRALIDHETRLCLGRTAASTLVLELRETGLWGRIEINPDDTDAMNLYARVKRGDVNQCSFGFDILEESYEVREDGSVLWKLQKVKLYEVSVVTFPAYEDTGVQARKQQYGEIRLRQREAWQKQMRDRLKGAKNRWH